MGYLVIICILQWRNCSFGLNNVVFQDGKRGLAQDVFIHSPCSIRKYDGRGVVGLNSSRDHFVLNTIFEKLDFCNLFLNL